MAAKHIFISYVRADSRFAATLQRKLEDAHFPVWRDPDIKAGESWRQAIDDAVRAAGALLVVMSPQARDSAYVNYEWTFALGAGVKVVPVLLGLPADALHPRLSELQALDFTDPRARDWPQLLSRLEQLWAAGPPAPPPLRGAPPALENAAAALDSTDSAERARAIQTLQQMDHPQVAEVLARALRHTLRDVRFEAGFALLDRGDLRGLAEVLEGGPQGHEQLARLYDDLRRVGPAAVPELLRAIAHSHPLVRAWAARLMDHFNEGSANPAFLPPLTQALADTDSHVRSTAVGALESYGPAAPLHALAECLRDESSDVRDAAAWVLGKLGRPAAAGPLTEALAYPDCIGEMRLRVIRALGQVRNPAALPALIAILDSDQEFRGEAAEALGRIGDPAAIPALVQAVEDERVGYRVADALVAVGGPAALSALLSILRNRGSNGRGWAARALGNLQDRAAVPDLLAALQDDDPGVRGSAAYALGKFKDPDFVPGLRSLLNDPDEDVKRPAVDALEEIGNRQAVAALAEALTDSDVSAQAQNALSRMLRMPEAKAALKAFRKKAAG